MMHHIQSVELIQTCFEKLLKCVPSLLSPPLCTSPQVLFLFTFLPSVSHRPLLFIVSMHFSPHPTTLLGLCSHPLLHSLSTSLLTLAVDCWQSSVWRGFCWSWDFSSSWDQWDPDMSQQPLMKKEKSVYVYVCHCVWEEKELEKVVFYHDIKNVLGKMHPHIKQYVRTQM